MKKHRFYKMATILSTVTLLSGCLSELDKEIVEETIAPDHVAVQPVENQISTDFYRAVMTDGKYELGIASSSNYGLSSSGNILAFEEGLLRISKNIFPTEQYFLREGQVIDNETMTNWLGRESATNPEGLNPANTQQIMEETTLALEQEDSDEVQETQENSQVIVDSSSTPIYLSQLMEKNLMVETEDGFSLSGIIIGLAMNSVYEYTDSDGLNYKQEISLGEMRERGRSYANIIVGRLRNTESLRNVPIVVAIFRQSPTDSLAGGTFVMHGISREGNYISDWTEQNEYRVSLPITSSSEYSDQYAFFDTFSSQVINFFPHLNGVTGEALYIDNILSSLTLEIVTQFYQQTEITALTQHLTDVANQTLPQGIPIEINVTSVHGAEAVLMRDGTTTQFNSYIFVQ